MLHVRAVVLAAALVLAPLGTGARGADLVVWWEQGFYPEEDQAARALVRAFEAETGKRVELVLQPYREIIGRVEAALAAGRPPERAADELIARLEQLLSE